MIEKTSGLPRGRTVVHPGRYAPARIVHMDAAEGRHFRVPLCAALTGVVADTRGDVHGGPFVAGANAVCVTFEITLEKWLPSDDS